MAFDPDDVRRAVDVALRRHLERKARSSPVSAPAAGGVGARLYAHSSHARFTLAHPAGSVNAEGTVCVVEPTVSCTHCGYCLSYGH